jgi:hypothetical protein
MALFTGRKKATKGGTRADTSGGALSANAESAAAVGQGSSDPEAAAEAGTAIKGPQGALEQLEALSKSDVRFKALAADGLRVILDALRVHRGALLIFDPFDQTLVLAADRGLDQQGRERLRRVRRNDPRSWEMPLHGLLTERAYLIDEPASNRYVPALLEHGNAPLARIACLPLFRQHKPVGVIVLLVGRNERFAEPEVRASQVWLRYLSTVIDDLRERDGMAALATDEDGAPASPGRPPGVAAAPRAPAPARNDADEVHPLRLRIAELESRDRDARSELERLATAHASAAAEVRNVSESHDRAGEHVVATLRAELTREQTRAVEALRVERDRHAAAIADLSRTVESDRAGLEAARAAHASVIAEVGVRDRRLAEVEARNAALDAERTTTLADLRRASERAEGLEATLAREGDQRADLQSALDATRAQTQATERTIAELRGALATVTNERKNLADELAVRRSHATERGDATGRLERALAEADADRLRLATELERARAEAVAAASAAERSATVERENREAAEGSRVRAEELAQRVTALEHALASAKAATAGVVQIDGSAAADRRAWEAQTATLSARVQTLEADLAAAERRAAEVSARAEALLGERDALRQIAETARAATAALEARLATAADTMRQAVARAEVAESERTHWRAEAECADARIGALTPQVSRLGTDVAQAKQIIATQRETIARREQEIAQLQERVTAIDAARTAAAAAEAVLRTGLAAHETEVHERSRDAAALRAAAAQLEHDQTALRAEVGRARADTDRAREDAESARTAAERAQAEETRTRADLERTRGDLERTRTEAERECAEASAAANAATEQASALTIERDVQVQQVIELTAALTRLEARRPAAVTPEEPVAAAPRGAADPKVRDGARERLPANSGVSVPQRLLVVEPNAAIAKNLLGGFTGDVQVVVPKEGGEGVVAAAVANRATVVVVNLSARGLLGGFHVIQAVRRAFPGSEPRLWAYAAPPQATKGVAVGFVDWIPQPADGDALVAHLGQLGARGIRALSVGLDMQLLLSVRKQITQQGVSLSMACDSKQGQELRDMVNPQLLLVDLDLPRGDGYRAIGRLIGDTTGACTWVLCGGVPPPTEAGSLLVTGAMERAASSFHALCDLGRVCLQGLKTTPPVEDETGVRARSRARPTTASARVRETATPGRTGAPAGGRAGGDRRG